jgi:hypothetical protein
MQLGYWHKWIDKRFMRKTFLFTKTVMNEKIIKYNYMPYIYNF